MTATYIVTGATSGIGYGVSRSLLAQGHKVLGIGRDFAKNPIQSDCFIPYSVDFSQTDRLPELFRQLSIEHPAITGLICCAGRGQFGSLEEFSYNDIEGLMAVNYTSHVFLIKTYMPLLKRQGFGKIIIIGSESGLKGARYGSIYCASKFALRGFAESIRQETARQNINISLVNPGLVRTAFFDDLNFKPGPEKKHAITVDTIVNVINYLLALPAESNVDEINLSPLQHVVSKHSPGNSSSD